MSDYIPSVAEFRVSYRVTHADLDSTESIERADAAFERGIEQVRADERAKLQDRIEELEKNLSYEVEQKIKLADTLRDERAKRPDRDRYVSEAHRRYSGSGNHPGGERHAFLAGVDAVLSSLEGGRDV